jgi:hypothetical protein
MDNSDIGILSPIKIGYLSLLLFGAFVVNCSQRVATIESFLSNVCYALRDGDRGQQLAIIESLVFNARYWIIKEDFFLYRSRMYSQLCCYFCYYYYLP